MAPSDEGKTLPSGERCLSEGQTEWGEGAAEAIARLGERNTGKFCILSLPPSRLTPCHLPRQREARAAPRAVEDAGPYIHVRTAFLTVGATCVSPGTRFHFRTADTPHRTPRLPLRLAKSRPAGGCSRAQHLRVLVMRVSEAQSR